VFTHKNQVYPVAIYFKNLKVALSSSSQSILAIQMASLGWTCAACLSMWRIRRTVNSIILLVMPCRRNSNCITNELTSGTDIILDTFLSSLMVILVISDMFFNERA
jgi:hypothetical protein